MSKDQYDRLIQAATDLGDVCSEYARAYASARPLIPERDHAAFDAAFTTFAEGLASISHGLGDVEAGLKAASKIVSRRHANPENPKEAPLTDAEQEMADKAIYDALHKPKKADKDVN
jgi:hypothetical protein